MQKFDPTFYGEGLTFTIQNNAANALGTGGRDLGYGGIANSLAIKFDARQNPSTADPAGSSTGLFLNGAVPLGGSSLPFDLTTNQIIQVDISYASSMLTVTVKNTVTNVQVTNNYSVNIPAIVGGNRAYLGFTGSTSNITSLLQNVRTWTYTAVQQATVTGDITLEAATRADVPLTFTFRPTDNSGNIVRIVTPAADGTYSVSVPQKAYNVHIKGSKWLSEVITVDASGGDVSGRDATLRGGDATGDNFVDVDDLSALVASFDADPSAPNWNNGVADFDLNDIVDVDDLSMLIRNFDAEGDP
jgi:hypothetical protein